jgi:hypothetical protein
VGIGMSRGGGWQGCAPPLYRVGAAGGGLAVSSILKPLVLRLPKVNEGEEAGT